MSPAALMQYVGTFDGKDVRFYVFRGRPCILAATLGAILGYAENGGALVRVMRKDWGNELIPGRDFDVLTGEDLAEFKAGMGDPDRRSGSKTQRLTILYESGVDLVCLKTQKPVGIRLRRFVADEVAPKLRRGEAVLPTAEPPPVFAPAPTPAPTPALPVFAPAPSSEISPKQAVASLVQAAILSGDITRAEALLKLTRPMVDALAPRSGDRGRLEARLPPGPAPAWLVPIRAEVRAFVRAENAKGNTPMMGDIEAAVPSTKHRLRLAVHYDLRDGLLENRGVYHAMRLVAPVEATPRPAAPAPAPAAPPVPAAKPKPAPKKKPAPPAPVMPLPHARPSKAPEPPPPPSAPAAPSPAPAAGPSKADLVHSALVKQGFKKHEATRAVRALGDRVEREPLPELIRAALAVLHRPR